MFSSPLGAVIGAENLDRTSAFLSLFGFHPAAKSELSAEAAAVLHGHDGPLELVTLTAASELGIVQLVGSLPSSPTAHDAYRLGAHAFDVYTRDIAASAESARSAGWSVGPIGHVELGPLVMDQVMVTGPDDLVVVLIQSDRRRPSLLDTDPGAAHSEGHSLVWAVDDVSAALDFWRQLPGLVVPFDAPVAHPEVNRFMGLPDQDVTLRMAMVCDDAVTPMRFELLQFVGVESSPARAPGTAGLLWPLFTVENLDSAAAAIVAAGGSTTQTAGTDQGRTSIARAPGGERLQLVERP